MRFSKKAVDGLRDSMIPKYDLKYLNDVDVSQEVKDVVREDKKELHKAWKLILKTSHRRKFLSLEQIQDTKVESVQGSFDNLPTASTYTKYIMRQYRPDSARQTSIQVSLTMSPVNSGCAHFACCCSFLEHNNIVNT